MKKHIKGEKAMEIIKTEITLDYENCGLDFPAVAASLTGFILPKSADAEGVYMGRLRPAVIICPGGAYRIKAYHEGEPVALEFSAKGFQSFVLDYSVSPMVFPGALFELSQAVCFVRAHAEEYGIDKNRISVVGFSAGGHLAASLCVYWKEPFVQRALGYDNDENRPNGAVLSYPVISNKSGIVNLGSMQNLIGKYPSQEEIDLFGLEEHVSSNTPPSFLWHTFEDDAVDVQNSLLFATELKKADVPFELHVFEKGSHGISLANEVTSNHLGKIEAPCQIWIELAIKFLERH